MISVLLFLKKRLKKIVFFFFVVVVPDGTPTWHMKPENVTLYNSQYYILPCKAYAYPAASYRWTKNGYQISDTGIKIGTYNLTFVSASNRHTGWYKCLALNEYGSISQSVYVKVVSGMNHLCPETNKFIPGFDIIEQSQSILNHLNYY